MENKDQRLSPLRGEGDSFFEYDDGHVQAVVQTHQDNGKSLAIYEWSCQGEEHSSSALAWLRERYDFISVHGIGENAEDPRAKFWLPKAQKGLVDQLFFDDHSQANIVEEGVRKPRPV